MVVNSAASLSLRYSERLINPCGTIGNLRPFQPGQSGNPGGKPVGSRNQLHGDFLNALCADFEVHGVKAIERCREEFPVKYLEVVLRIVIWR